MISVTQLRQGISYLEKEVPFKVLKYAHTHMGRGGGTIRVTVQNLHTGGTLARTYKSGEKVEEVAVMKKKMQYLYQDGQDLVLMDPLTFEQLTVPRQLVGEKVDYLTDGADVWIHLWDKEEPEVLELELPAKVIMTVKTAAPGERGNTAANSYKEGMLENGFKVKIPLFVNQGDQIKINTVDGSYIERV